MSGQRSGMSLSHARVKQLPASTTYPCARMREAKVSASAPKLGVEEVVSGGFEWIASANSGKSESGFQSVLPSSWTLLWALARPAAIQARIWSAVTGPYSWPSFPIILYMVENGSIGWIQFLDDQRSLMVRKN